MIYDGFAEISANGRTIRLNGSTRSYSTLYITDAGVEGWYGTPDLKVSLSERGQGDGAHDVSEMDILYSARTVTIHYGCIGTDRREALDLLSDVQWYAHRSVRLRIIDGGYDTYCEGYVASTVNPEWESDCSWNDTLTIVCPRPERLSWRAKRSQLFPIFAGNWSGGIRYGDDRRGLAYPVSYGAVMSDGRNVCSLANDGSSRAYPVFTLHGPLDAGCTLQFPGFGRIRYEAPVSGSVVLDCREGTAMQGGASVGRSLSERAFAYVEAGGALRCVFTGSGSGWCDVELHDTWM